MQTILKIPRINNVKILSNFAKQCRYILAAKKHTTSVTELIAEGYEPENVEYLKSTPPSTSPPGPNKYGTFRMILPPPNVTGDLHLGHALMATIQDVICRHHRQLGYHTEWIPGTDHAGIATQVLVEKKLRKERGLTRVQAGLTPFLSEVWKWKRKRGEAITQDLMKMGCTLDWEREYFTLDEKQSRAVNAAFIKLFEDKLIQRKKTLVNWSCALQSTISDIEVEMLDIKGPTLLSVPGYADKIEFGRIYDIIYRFTDIDGNIVVSTTRPETMLGDVAVAVHPEDPRYKQYRDRDNTFLWHPFRNEHIPLIFDTSVDPELGTGAVKITPAHDRKDFEIAKRHLIDPIPVFTPDGCIERQFVYFQGQPRFEARVSLLKALQRLELLGDVKPHSMILPICSRSKDVLEYMLQPQWFLRCDKMAEAALSAVHSGRLQIIPENFEIDWERWLQNCQDWCISRQLWWGHRIPAYFAQADNGQSCWVAAMDEKDAVVKAKRKLKSQVCELQRDEDVLDTWFSSALLPFSAFGWPINEYKSHYPLDLMQTGHDILFFWVARMVMLGLKLTGELPFKRILLNGIVCDAHGRKMSKSLGNIITPQQVADGCTLQEMQASIEESHKGGIISKEEMYKSIKGMTKMFPNGIPKCGIDALRFTLCTYNIKNHFINFDVNECYTNKLFLNKVWQGTRFTIVAAERLNLEIHKIETLENAQLNKWDRWILSRLADTLLTVTQGIEHYNLHVATAALKQFLYHNFCDTYLETTKQSIKAGTSAGYIHCATLATCLSCAIEAMSIFTPYIAEELLKHLPTIVRLNLSRQYDAQLEEEIGEVLNVCQAVRKLKSSNGISKKHEPKVCVYVQTPAALHLFSENRREMSALTLTKEVTVELVSQGELKRKREAMALFSTAGPLCSFGIYVNHEYRDAFKKRTDDINSKKLERLQNELDRYLKRVESEGFKLSATDKVQQWHKQKIEELVLEIENMKN